MNRVIVGYGAVAASVIGSPPGVMMAVHGAGGRFGGGDHAEGHGRCARARVR